MKRLSIRLTSFFLFLLIAAAAFAWCSPAETAYAWFSPAYEIAVDAQSATYLGDGTVYYAYTLPDGSIPAVGPNATVYLSGYFAGEDTNYFSCISKADNTILFAEFEGEWHCFATAEGAKTLDAALSASTANYYWSEVVDDYEESFYTVTDDAFLAALSGGDRFTVKLSEACYNFTATLYVGDGAGITAYPAGGIFWDDDTACYYYVDYTKLDSFLTYGGMPKFNRGSAEAVRLAGETLTEAVEDVRRAAENETRGTDDTDDSGLPVILFWIAYVILFFCPAGVLLIISLIQLCCAKQAKTRWIVAAALAAALLLVNVILLILLL